MSSVDNVLWAGVNTDGSVNATASPDNAKEANRGSSVLGKDAFLNLLVAQMKYQDPLNPTSDTEWISQMATFSTLEEMQNMNTTLGNSQALSLVGKTVIVNSEDSLIGGKVDYVLMQAGEAYLSINDSLYSVDQLDTVADYDYLKLLKEQGLISGEIAESDTQKILKALEALGVKIDDMGSSVDKAADSIKDVAESMVRAAEGMETAASVIGSAEADKQVEADKKEEDKAAETDKTGEAGEITETDKTAESEAATEPDTVTETDAAEEAVEPDVTEEAETTDSETTEETADETVTTE